MRTPVVVLSITALAFATSTAYLAYELKTERIAATNAAPPEQESTFDVPNSDTSALVPLGTSQGSPAITEASPQGTASRQAHAAMLTGNSLPDMRTEYQIASAKLTFQTMNDPVLRANAVARFKDEQIAQLASLRDRLKLDAQTFGTVVGLLAEDMQLQQENHARCVLDRTCDMMNTPEASNHSQELLALLGSDKYALLNSFRSTLVEWQSVVQLRGRLSEANYIGDASAERLMKALAGERESYYREVQQQGATTAGFGNINGMVNYSTDGSIDQQLASAAQYSQRMRERAADVLNVEQLHAFNQLQDDLLAGLANHLHESRTSLN